MNNSIKYKTSIDDTSNVALAPMNYQKRNDSSLGIDSGFVFVISDGKKIDITSGLLTPNVANLHSILCNYEIKENFYAKAIKNLIKKNDYLQLTMQFDQDLISEDEFYDELEQNEDSYLIKIDHSFNESDFKFINEIIHRLEKDFSSDEIAEIFSIPIEVVNMYIDAHIKHLDK